MSGSLSSIGVGAYLQEEFAVRRTGEHARLLGKKAFVLGGDTALSVAGRDLLDSLRDAGVEAVVERFTGFCTPGRIASLGERFRRHGADVVIGVGGGRAIDTAKGVALTENAPIIAVPTSVATCASFASVIVTYDENGDPRRDLPHLKRPIDFTLVDTDIIARKCPVRMLSTGIADSLAKYVELFHLRQRVPGWTESLLPVYAWQMAGNVRDVQMEQAGQACRDVGQGVLSGAVEDVVAANVALTGYASVWGYRGFGTTFAHTLYYTMCLYCKEQQDRYLHGEMVSLGLPLQLMINGAPREEVEGMVRFLQSIGAPVYPADLGLVPTGEFCEQVLECCADKHPFFTEEDMSNARKHMHAFWLDR